MNFNRSLIVFMLLSISMSPMGFAADSRDAMIDAQLDMSGGVNAHQESSLADGLGKVYQIEGKAMIARRGNPIESKLKVGDMVQAGDAIYTGKKSSVSIAFDYLKKNAVHIPESSRAVLNSIEPTDIKLENGSVFNAVDGLAHGSTWKVTTPVAVAAVRGTVYLVRFEMANGEFYAATVDVPDDGKSSAIDIQLLYRDGLANIPEGKEITLREGETPSAEAVKDLNPEAVAEIKKFFEQLQSEQEKAKEEAEKTSANNNSSGETGDNLGDDGDSDAGDNPTGDNAPELDPGEDFKEEFGIKQLEDNLNKQDYEKCTGSHCSS